MSYDVICEALPGMNWNELASIIEEARKLRSEMETRAIGVMESVLDIMRERKSRIFPLDERNALYECLGLEGGYKCAIEVMDAFAKRKRVRFAVAAFAESRTPSATTAEYKRILRALYKCRPTDEPASRSWQEARERFWKEFEQGEV